MSVLTFFIITSMALSGIQIAGVNLPTVSNGGREQSSLPKPLIVGLNQNGEVIIDNKLTSLSTLENEIQAYLGQNSKGIVVLKADKNLSYKQVVQILKKMRNLGGDRISLAIERN